MLNIGFIGNIKLLEPYTQSIQQHKKAHIVGKSSVGTQPLPSGFRMQVPEFNRIELIERSDVLFINKFSLLPFSLICEMVKKSKHIFAASFPDLTSEEMNQLIKLADEARCVIQVFNPLYYLPGIQWIKNKSKRPFSIQIDRIYAGAVDKKLLLHMLLMLKDFTGSIPKKVNASVYYSSPQKAVYQHIQLNYKDGSAIVFHLTEMDGEPAFKLASYMQDLFAEFDFHNNNYIENGKHIDVPDVSIDNETNDFLNAIMNKRQAVSNLEHLQQATQVYDVIEEKLHRFRND